MYKNGSSSSELGRIGEGGDGFGAIVVDGCVAGEEGSEVSLSEEEPIDETFV